MRGDTFCSNLRAARLMAGIPLRLAVVSVAVMQLAGAAPVNAQTGSTAAGAVSALAGSTVTPTGSVSSALASKAESGAGSSLIAVPEDFAKLRIQPGFLLDTEVFDEPDLSGPLRVGSDGNMIMPLAGAVHVAGDTLAEAQQKIQDKLVSAEIMKSPQVTINVLQYAPTMVTVLGEVNTPGRLQMLVPHSLLDVLSFAGGETSLAGGEIDVRHEENGKTEVTTYHYGRNSDGDSISQVIVHDGDTVIVPRAGIVYVLGAVYRPGGYLMQEDGKLDAAQAISLAMGTMINAKTRDICIIRRNHNGTYVMFNLNYQDMVKGKITPPVLHAQDIVYVPVSKGKTVLSSATGIIGSTSAASIYLAR